MMAGPPGRQLSSEPAWLLARESIGALVRFWPTWSSVLCHGGEVRYCRLANVDEIKDVVGRDYSSLSHALYCRQRCSERRGSSL